MATAKVPNTTPRAIIPSRLTLAALDGSVAVDSFTLWKEKETCWSQVPDEESSYVIATREKKQVTVICITLVGDGHSVYSGSPLATRSFSLYWVPDPGRGRTSQLLPTNLHLNSPHHKWPERLDWNRRTVFFRLSCQILCSRPSFYVTLLLTPFARPPGRNTARWRAFR